MTPPLHHSMVYHLSPWISVTSRAGFILVLASKISERLSFSDFELSFGRKKWVFGVKLEFFDHFELSFRPKTEFFAHFWELCFPKIGTEFFDFAQKKACKSKPCLCPAPACRPRGWRPCLGRGWGRGLPPGPRGGWRRRRPAAWSSRPSPAARGSPGSRRAGACPSGEGRRASPRPQQSIWGGKTGKTLVMPFHVKLCAEREQK